MKLGMPRFPEIVLRIVLAVGLCGAFSTESFARTPLSYLQSFGSKADRVLALTWGLLIISIMVVIVMTLLVLWAVFRTRERPADDRSLGAAESQRSSVNVFGLGLGVTTLILLGSVAWTMVTLAAGDKPPEKPAVTIEITGHQWWWGVRYQSDKPSQVFSTANEIHIPTGKPVKIDLRSSDVIHSFWVPSLTGKTDMIPGQVNSMWLDARKPGVYAGQCTEYCGQQHAHMSFRVVAEAPDKFEAWRNNQLKPAPQPTTADAKKGLAVFERHCAGCHAVRGTPAGGVYGPDLSHLMTRAALASGTIPDRGGYLAGWIADPQHVKPGTQMPRVALTGDELQAVTTYLRTLH